MKAAIVSQHHQVNLIRSELWLSETSVLTNSGERIIVELV